MSALIWVVGAFLLIVSIIDWKVKKLPSILLTGFLFVVAYITLNTHAEALSLGILGFIMAILLYEADFFGGMADVKIMVMISLMLVNGFYLLGFFVLIGVFGITWKAIYKIRMKEEKECPFLPVFLFLYIAGLLLGAFII